VTILIVAFILLALALQLVAPQRKMLIRAAPRFFSGPRSARTRPPGQRILKP
jgi:hypothetical protein